MYFLNLGVKVLNKVISEVVRVGSIILFHLSKL